MDRQPTSHQNASDSFVQPRMSRSGRPCCTVRCFQSVPRLLLSALHGNLKKIEQCADLKLRHALIALNFGPATLPTSEPVLTRSTYNHCSGLHLLFWRSSSACVVPPTNPQGHERQPPDDAACWDIRFAPGHDATVRIVQLNLVGGRCPWENTKNGVLPV